MRISRGGEIIGERTALEVRRDVSEGTLLVSDCYYDEESSQWLPLGELLARPAEPRPARQNSPACYCGSGLPFGICCGDGGKY